MKVLIFSLISLLYIVGSSQPLLAAGSGACSYHGGVNCSVKDYDGSVICNDGWTGSSVMYSNVSECSQAAARYCPPPTSVGCKTEVDYRAMSVTQIQSGRSMYATEIAAGDLQACRSQIIQYQAQMTAYQLCLSQSSNQLSQTQQLTPTESCRAQFGLAAKASSDKPGYCICETGFVFNASNQCVRDTHQDEATLSQAIKTGGGTLEGSFDANTCPGSSSMGSPGSCKCNPGYFAVLDSCVLAQTYCHTRYGRESSYDYYQKDCLCESGYIIDQKTNQCRALADICREGLGLQSVAVLPNQCKCAQSAIIDSTTGKCESILILNQRGQQAALEASSSTNSVVQTTPVNNPVIVEVIPKTPEPAKKVVTSTRRVNVRLNPSAKAKIIGVTTIKKQYEFLSQNSSWVQVRFDNKVGWIMRNLVIVK